MEVPMVSRSDLPEKASPSQEAGSTESLQNQEASPQESVSSQGMLQIFDPEANASAPASSPFQTLSYEDHLRQKQNSSDSYEMVTQPVEDQMRRSSASYDLLNNSSLPDDMKPPASSSPGVELIEIDPYLDSDAGLTEISSAPTPIPSLESLLHPSRESIETRSRGSISAEIVISAEHSFPTEDWQNFISTTFSHLRNLSLRIMNGEFQDLSVLYSPQYMQKCEAVAHEVTQNMIRFGELGYKEGLYGIASNELQQLEPALIVQHLVALVWIGKDAAQWRRELYIRLSDEILTAIHKSLIEQLKSNPEESLQQAFVQIVKESIDCIYRQDREEILISLGLLLAASSQDQSVREEEWGESIHRHIASPQYLKKLFGKARLKKSTIAERILAQFSPLSILYGIDELSTLNSPGLCQHQRILITRLCQQIPSAKRQSIVGEILSTIDSIPIGPPKEFAYSLLQIHAPKFLEIHLVKRLPFTRSPQSRRLLLQQALAINTENIRAFLWKLLQNHMLASTPNLEEWILHYLSTTHDIDAVLFLQQRILEAELDLGIRTNAVWMLGSFSHPEIIPFLEHILTQPAPDYEAEEDWEAIQFMTLMALSRLPQKLSAPMYEKEKESLSVIHQVCSRMMLGEDIPFDYTGLYQESESATHQAHHEEEAASEAGSSDLEHN